MANTEGAIERAAAAIRAYLRAQPEAADTEDGIAHWWVYPVTGEIDLDDVRGALALLEQAGEIEPWQLGRRFLYRAGPSLRGA
ncbi:MAG TPA: hypothetical protein VFS49_01350 [Croceibacterium sp.]|nr:hypothetical protein [Croceibacterium sp.]